MPEVRIRPAKLEDIDNIMTWINDSEVTGYFQAMQAHITRDQELLFLAKMLMSKNEFAYSLEAEDGTYIGQSSINKIHWPSKEGHLFLVIGNPLYRGKGYAKSAVRKTLREAFEVHNLNRMELMVRSTNEKAQGIYEKCGFVKEGVMRQKYLIHGKYEDMVMMSALNVDYQKLKGGWQNAN